MRDQIAAKAFLGALWIVCVYRAVTQSITHDEALTYQLFLKGPFNQVFHHFSSNHHFLNTILMYLCVSLFGVSGWSMRLPALAGAALYFAAVYRVCRHAFGDGYLFLLGTGLLTLNPFILDFMVAARGYGVALGFWMWALALLLPHLENPTAGAPRKLVEAAVALSLSVVANLVFVLPAAVLAGLLIWLPRKPSSPPAKKVKRAAAAEPSITVYFVLPILGVALLFFLISPLESAGSADLYAGASTIQESLRSLAGVSIGHSGALIDAVAFVLAPGILLLGLGAPAFRRNLLMLLCSAVAIGSALLLVLLHLAFDLPYPLDRTGIYFLPLATLALLGMGSAAPRKVAAMLAYGVSGALLLAFAIRWNVHKFEVWEYDADDREIANRLAASVVDKRPDSVRVGSSWQLEPALNFYRDKNRFTWMQPVARAPLNQRFDFYVLAPVDLPVVASLGLTPLYKGPVSGTILARPK